jgi:S-(hydroxymethyl)glutathione dehydrogenase/alcohol dehydrogenase
MHWMKGTGIDSSTPSYHRNGQVVNAGWVTTFSDHSVVSENRLTPIRDTIAFDVASLLGCAVTTGLGIVLNNVNLKPGQSLAVFGVGGVGLNVIQGAALVSGYPIVAIDLIDSKLEQAKPFGATHTINSSKTDAAAALAELSGGRGFDAVVDATGIPEVIQTAFASTAEGGTTVLAGVPHHQSRITIDSYSLHQSRRLFGSHGGDTRPDVDIPRYIRLYELGKLKLDELITHRFPLERINEGIAEVRAGRVGRCVILMA